MINYLVGLHTRSTFVGWRAHLYRMAFMASHMVNVYTLYDHKYVIVYPRLTRFIDTRIIIYMTIRVCSLSRADFG